MKRTILTVVAIFMMGMAWAQSTPGKIGAVITKTAEGISNIEKSYEQAANVAAAEAIRNTKTTPTLSLLPQTNNPLILPKPKEIKVLSIQQYFNNDDWIEIGQITMKCEDGFTHDGASYRGSDQEALLYAKECQNGGMIYRVLYNGKYYAVSTRLLEDGMIKCSVTIDFQYYFSTYKLRYVFYI